MLIPRTIRQMQSDIISAESMPIIKCAITRIADNISYDFLPSYLIDTLDKKLVTDFGELRLRDAFSGQAPQPNFVNYPNDAIYSVATLFEANYYEYSTLYNTTILSYNPIENYNDVESEVIENEGEELTKSKLGEQTTTNKIGEQTNKIERGGLNGLETTTTGETTTVHETSAYNTSNFKNREREITTKSPIYIETHNENQTDTQSIGQQTNTNTVGEQENDEKVDTKSKTTRTLTKRGNIGVTTSQQMLDAERQIAMFSFVDIVLRDVVNLLAKGVW